MNPEVGMSTPRRTQGTRVGGGRRGSRGGVEESTTKVLRERNDKKERRTSCRVAVSSTDMSGLKVSVSVSPMSGGARVEVDVCKVGGPV